MEKGEVGKNIGARNAKSGQPSDEEHSDRDGKKNVLMLGLASFLNDFSSEMIMPILPFFLTSLGASPVIIGLVGGVRDALANLLKFVFGYYSDMIGKRMPFVYAGYANSAVWKIALAFAPSPLFALATVSLERLGKGMRDAPRDAMISQLMPTKTGAGFGLHQALDTAGALLGSAAVALLLLYMKIDYWLIIAVAGAIALLSITPLIFVREPRFVQRQNGFEVKEIKNALSKDLLIFTVIASLFALANFSYMFFIMKVQLTEGLVIPVLLYILFNIFYALFAYPIGKYADRIGKREVLIMGYVLFAIVSLGFAINTSLPIFMILFILYGISFAMVSATQRAYAADISPPEYKGASLGIFQTVTGFIALPAGLIAGYLWQSFSPQAAFYFGVVVASISAVLLFVLKPRP